MHHRAIHAVEHGVHHRLAHRDRTDRDVAAGQCLRHADHVGFHAPVLDGEKLAGAPEAGLDLVRHQQRAVGAAEPRRLG